MIENLFEKGLEQAKNYKISDTRKLSNEQLRHLYAVTNWQFILCYGLLENIFFAIRKKECDSVEEIAKFIDARLDRICYEVESRIPVMLENEEE